MMGILRTILFAATGLAATGAAFAQQTDSASLFRTQREHASPVAALAATAYATPALRSEAFAVKREIAESWPNSLDDTCAREEWGWKPEWDLSRMTDDMLAHIRAKLGAE